jgi:hypothetical protein
MSPDKNIPSELFGQVRTPQRPGNCQVNPLELQAPLRFDQAGATALAEKAKAPLPENRAEYYFLVQTCEVCGNDYQGVELHPVPGK